MSTRKKPALAERPRTVRVRVSCTYAGDGWAVFPGEIAEVDADEADRLIGLGVASLVEAE